MTHPQTFVARLRSAGVEPGDLNDLRIRKSIMVFAMGLMTAAPMLWLVLYRLLGLQLSATLPFAFQVISAATLVIYIVTGVVGTKKFIYDLWGDTVNMASRITSEGVPGMIQVDATSYRRLRGRFDFHPPQALYLKSKGETLVYRLIGRTTRAHEGTGASLTET